MASSTPIEVTVHVLQAGIDRQNAILDEINKSLKIVAAAHELHLKRDDRIYG